jgi:hypothetical protein
MLKLIIYAVYAISMPLLSRLRTIDLYFATQDPTTIRYYLVDLQVLHCHDVGQFRRAYCLFCSG